MGVPFPGSGGKVYDEAEEDPGSAEAAEDGTETRLAPTIILNNPLATMVGERGEHH